MNIVFDTEVLLAYYLGEPAGKKVENLLRETMRRENTSYLNIVNLMELYYILYRKSPDLADDKEANLRGYGVEIVPVDDDALWREAARIKAAHAISLADSLAAATAKMKTAKLLVGRDEEFQGLDIAVERIS
ncbi:PIN domain-containing protein [Candidatus Bathyarchaeota archaeon]|nr:PIN domain-containing protein [Candidatus Bathyarchaeota archaeon]